MISRNVLVLCLTFSYGTFVSVLQVGGRPECAFAAAVRTWALVCRRKLSELGRARMGSGEVVRLVTAALSDVWPGMVPLDSSGDVSADPEAEQNNLAVTAHHLVGTLQPRSLALATGPAADVDAARRRRALEAMGVPAELEYLQLKLFCESHAVHERPLRD